MNFNGNPEDCEGGAGVPRGAEEDGGDDEADEGEVDEAGDPELRVGRRIGAGDAFAVIEPGIEGKKNCKYNAADEKCFFEQMRCCPEEIDALQEPEK